MPRRNRRYKPARKFYAPPETEPSYDDLARQLVADGRCTVAILVPGKPRGESGEGAPS